MRTVRLAVAFGLLLAPVPATPQALLTRAELLLLAESGFALGLAEACGEWGDARWFAEVRRRIRLLAALGTPARTDRALFEGAFVMAERHGVAQIEIAGRYAACRGVAISSARRSYDDLMADDRLAGHAVPAARD